MAVLLYTVKDYSSQNKFSGYTWDGTFTFDTRNRIPHRFKRKISEILTYPYSSKYNIKLVKTGLYPLTRILYVAYKFNSDILQHRT